MNKADLKLQIWQTISSYRLQIDPNTRDLLLADLNKILDQEDLKVDNNRVTDLEATVAGLREVLNNHNKRLMVNTEKLEVLDEALVDYDIRFDGIAERLGEAHERLRYLESKIV